MADGKSMTAVAGEALTQYYFVIPDGDTNERMLIADDPDNINTFGVCENSTADAAGDQVDLAYAGQSRVYAAEALEPFDLITTNASGQAKVADPGDVVLGRYLGKMRQNGSNLQNGAASSAPSVLLNPFPFRLTDLRCAQVLFDPTTNSSERTVAAHTLAASVPDNAIVVQSFFDVVATFTGDGGDTSTLAFATSAGGITFNAAQSIASAAAQKYTLTPGSPQNDAYYTVTITADIDGDGIVEAYTYAVLSDGTATAAEVVNALVAAINDGIDQHGSAGNTIVAANDTDTLTLTAEGTFAGTRPFSVTAGCSNASEAWGVVETTAFTYTNRWDAGVIIPGNHQLHNPATWQKATALGLVQCTVGTTALLTGKCYLNYWYFVTA